MRLFFGLSLPEDIRDAAAARAQQCSAVIPGRYAIKENYHVTLAFLGDVPPERLRDACDVLAREIAGAQPPVLTFGETAHFGRAQNAILILALLSDPPLDALHARLVHGLQAAGLPADPGPFSPHITLARHACLPDAPLPAGRAVSFVPGCAHVFLSARDESGVLRYTPLFTCPFAGK